jgi:hypothetical protein
MVMAYRETPEDQALTAAFRWYNGQKIDTRWSGGWLTPKGEYYPVDYRNGITHDTLAEEHGSLIRGSGSITTRPPVMRLFDIAEWMRITYIECTTFCVELKGRFKTRCHDRQQVMIDFILGQRRFESYYINDTRYGSCGEFVSAIMVDRVWPKRGQPEPGEAQYIGWLRARQRLA